MLRHDFVGIVIHGLKISIHMQEVVYFPYEKQLTRIDVTQLGKLCCVITVADFATMCKSGHSFVRNMNVGNFGYQKREKWGLLVCFLIVKPYNIFQEHAHHAYHPLKKMATCSLQCYLQSDNHPRSSIIDVYLSGSKLYFKLCDICTQWANGTMVSH